MIAKEGGDPGAERDGGTENAPPTFAEAARKVFEEHNAAWKNPKHRQHWLNTMEAYTFPVIFVTAAVGRFGADAIAGYGLASRLHSSALRNA